MTIARHPRKKAGLSCVHYGTIGSANQVLRDPAIRDKLRHDSDIICVEMEAGGLMNDFPCVVVRGVCDYCDSHKNKLWQPYAAAVAAAYSKELLQTILPMVVVQEQPARELMNTVEEISQGIRATQTNIEKINEKITLDSLTYAKGATFDAFANVHELDAKCLQGTRLDLLRQIRTWATSSESKSIFWLNGAAGTGKSTVARTVAEEFQISHQLGGSFFFKRGEGDLGSASKFFSTIARQLALFLPDLGVHIKTAIEADPEIADKVLREQFERLILDPFTRMAQTSTKPLLLVVDALDECDSDENIRLLINLLSRPIAGNLIRVLLTSRPELPIRLGFSMLPTATYQNFVLQEIPADTVKHDLSVYLKYRFDRIKSEHEDIPPDWPGRENLHLLVDMAYPLFIFAATICRFVADPMWQPEEQLKYLLSSKYIPGDEIDRTYSPILTRLLCGSLRRRTELIDDFKAIVGPIVVVVEPLSISGLAFLLGIEQDRINVRLATLHSVLSIPLHGKTHAPIRMLHLSFANFLLDPDRKHTHEFWIDEKQTHLRLAQRCLSLLSTSDNLRQDLCNLQHPGVLRNDIDVSLISESIPEAVQYACKYWVLHMERCQNLAVSLEHETCVFLKRYFLYWFEAMSILGQAANMIYLVDILSGLAQQGSTLVDLTYDARRFVLTWSYIVNIAPLQLYCSSVVFTPKSSFVKACPTRTTWLKMLSGESKNWNSAMQTLEGHLGAVTTVAWSPCKSKLASGSADKSVKLWNTISGHLLQTFHGHLTSIHTAIFSPDGRSLASGSIDATVKLWDIATATLMQTFGLIDLVEPGLSLRLRLEEDYSKISSDSLGPSATNWPRDYAMAFTIDGESLAHTSSDGDIRLLQVHSGQMQQISTPKASMRFEVFDRELALSANGKKLAFAASDATVDLWDLDLRQVQHTLRCFGLGIMRMAFSSDASILAIAEAGLGVMIMNVASGKPEQYVAICVSGAIALSPDNKTLVSESEECISLSEISSGNLKRSFYGHPGKVNTISFSYDSQSLASSSDDRTIRLWNPHSEHYQKDSISYDESRVLFSPDWKLIISSHGGWTIKVWNIISGQLCLQQEVPQIHKNLVLSSDGRLLAFSSYGEDRVYIELWYVSPNGLQYKYTVVSSDSTVKKLVFSRDDKLIACFTTRAIQVWNVDSGFRLYNFDVLGYGYFDPEKISPPMGGDPNNDQILEQFNLSKMPREEPIMFDVKDNWLYRNYRRLLWIPPDYRGKVTVSQEMVAIVLNEECIVLLQISFEELDRAGL